jgi:CheY-like chemotaxis protein
MVTMLGDRIQPILLVEDEPDDASFVRRALEKSSIVNELRVCATAREAREHLESADGDEMPVLAIVDIYLPNGESGLDFLAWLRRQPPPLGDMPTMIFTTSVEMDHKVEASALRSIIFISKPANEESLAAAAQALGFVITTTVAGGRARRVIERR